MRFWVVWVYLSWKDSQTVFTPLVRALKKLPWKVACFVSQHLHYKLLFVTAHSQRLLGLTSHAQKNRARVGNSNYHCLLGEKRDLDLTWTRQRREILDLAATWGRSNQVRQQLARCSEQLDSVVAPLHAAGTPVILAPLHMVSDVLCGIIAANVTPGKATVIVSSSIQVETLNAQARQLGGVNLSYCSIHSDSKLIAGGLMAAIEEASALRTNIVVFPDITPDYTLNTNETRSAKFPCRLFGRPAKLHSGIIRLARMLSAQVVFYHLHYDRQIKIHIEPPVPAKALKKRMPEIIEACITRHPDDWMLWHAHSLYFIND